ncbi:MAG: hypothetical protein QXJ73_04725 [Candidatus Caldarchaeum sp.]
MAWPETKESRRKVRDMDPHAFFDVVRALAGGPKAFYQVVEASGRSRRLCWKVLRELLTEDFATVDYVEHRALYWLKHDFFVGVAGSEIIPSNLFQLWWSMGRPHVDDFLNSLPSEVENMDYMARLDFSLFLYVHYPHLRIGDPRFFDHSLPTKGKTANYKQLFETVNDWRRRRKTLMEDVVLSRIVDAFFAKKICPSCFRRGELFLLDIVDGYYVCANRRCGASFKKVWAYSKLKQQFEEWRARGETIKLGKLTIRI